jgi:phage baseplate assembly protein W
MVMTVLMTSKNFSRIKTMPISIIFPIEFLPDPTPNPRLGIEGRYSVATSAMGVGSYADWSQSDAIKQNLKMLLLTRPGEYVMDSSYGIGLQDYLFLQEQEVDTASLESLINTQAGTYMPYITISDSSVTLDPLNSMLRIRIEFFYNELTIPEVFELEVI